MRQTRLLTPGAIVHSGFLNASEIDFGRAANAAVIPFFGLFDAPSGGNMLNLLTPLAPISVQANSPIAIAIGTVSVRFT